MKLQHGSYEACRRGDCPACAAEERAAECIELDETYDPFEQESTRQDSNLQPPA